MADAGSSSGGTVSIGGSWKGAHSRRTSLTLKPFTQESLSRLETRTSSVIRDYGFLPRRTPTVTDGGRLPNQFEPFPRYMYGRPLEELDHFIFEEVSVFGRIFFLCGSISLKVTRYATIIKSDPLINKTFQWQDGHGNGMGDYCILKLNYTLHIKIKNAKLNDKCNDTLIEVQWYKSYTTHFTT